MYHRWIIDEVLIPLLCNRVGVGGMKGELLEDSWSSGVELPALLVQDGSFHDLATLKSCSLPVWCPILFCFYACRSTARACHQWRDRGEGKHHHLNDCRPIIRFEIVGLELWSVQSCCSPRSVNFPPSPDGAPPSCLRGEPSNLTLNALSLLVGHSRGWTALRVT